MMLTKSFETCCWTCYSYFLSCLGHAYLKSYQECQDGSRRSFALYSHINQLVYVIYFHFGIALIVGLLHFICFFLHGWEINIQNLFWSLWNLTLCSVPFLILFSITLSCILSRFQTIDLWLRACLVASGRK